MAYRARRNQRNTPESIRDEAIQDGQLASVYDFRQTLEEFRRENSKKIEEINSVTYLIFENYRNTYPDINPEKLLELAVGQTPLILEKLKNK